MRKQESARNQVAQCLMGESGGKCHEKEIRLDGVKLFLNGHIGTIRGESVILDGPICFTATHHVRRQMGFHGMSETILDSGAFSDVLTNRRVSISGALDRQLSWEESAQRLWELPEFHVDYLVSYDRLIDEQFINGERRKERWGLYEGEEAVRETIEAARYLAGMRESLSPRRLILSAQGVDAMQYKYCVEEILAVAAPEDVIGLGGWCILGKRPSLLPEFWRSLDLILPMIAAAGIKRVHIFGVMWFPALGGLLWLCDQYGLEVSTDSTGPIIATTYKDWRRAGARFPDWQSNVAWWQKQLRELRGSKWYKRPVVQGMMLV